MSISQTVFIVSPFRGDVKRNVALARRICLRAIELGHAPFAAHLHYPQFLDDTDPKQRDKGRECALAWLEASDIVWVCETYGISEGMEEELALAKKIGKRVATINLKMD